MARFAGFVVVIAACASSHEKNVTVADLATKMVTVAVTADGTQVTFQLDNVPIIVDDEPTPQDCIVLQGTATATLDGMAMVLSSRGSYNSQDSSCELPTLQLATTPLAPTSLSMLAITDGTATVSASIGGLRAPRAFSVGAVQAGMQATFTWSVPTDQFPFDQLGNPDAQNDEFWWTPTTGSGFVVGPAYGNESELTFSGTTLIAMIPSTATTGPGQFGFEAGFAPAFTECELDFCTAVAPTPPPLAATISP